MARLIFAILVLAATVVQALIFPDVLTIRILPNLVLVLLLSWSALRGLGEAALWAFAAGILFDAMSLDPMGTNALAFLAVCVLGTWAGRVVTRLVSIGSDGAQRVDGRGLGVR